MKIQVFSDVHLEAYHDPAMIWNFVKPKAKVAVVAGDIHSRKFELAVAEIATKFEQVICVMGNHEWYGRDISWRPDVSMMPPNVHVLDRGTYEYKDTIFIGVTLWTDFKGQNPIVRHACRDMINDFRVIRCNDYQSRFGTTEAIDLHMKDRAFIKMMVEKYRNYDNKKIVVISHFMPSYQCVHPKWKANPGTDTLNWYFSAQCDDLLAMEGINLWICGHTHDTIDSKFYGTRLVCNPLGYPKENPDYKDKVVRV